MIRQSQQQKLVQKLSPQQIQLMKLLQVPTYQLEERIKEELEENPALEFELDATPNDEYSEDENLDDIELSDDSSEKIDLEDFVKGEKGEGSDYEYDGDYNPNKNTTQSFVRVESSFHDFLLGQLQLLSISEKEQKIAEQIMGSIDEDGYLRREVFAIVDDLAFSQNLITTVEEVKEMVKLIQQLDPPGVCAQSLQECLLLQCKRLANDTPGLADAHLLLTKYFDEFIRKHYEKIQKQLNLSDATFKEVLDLILKLNPKPGSTFSSGSGNKLYIIPDFFVFNDNGRLEVSLNSKNAPELRVSRDYIDMMETYQDTKQKDKRQKEALLFIKQKLDAAKWFIDAIKQRQRTLLNTMQAIVEYQQSFFISGADTDLRPMILKDIAEMTQLDISTISRVANSKYVQTEFGTFLLKYFFSESLQTDDGEEVSTREVKSILTKIVDQENKRKPYSDDKLMELLKEQGYSIARRTVAKYREQLNIPVARLRRQI